MKTHRLYIIFILLCTLLAPLSSPTQGKSFAAFAANTTTEKPWLDVQHSGGIVYLLYPAPANSIKRYRISTETWLPDIHLSASPTAFRVTPDAIYVAFGLRAAKLPLSGSSETHLLDTDYEIKALHATGQYLIIDFSTYQYTNFINFNLTTFTIMDVISYIGGMIGTSLAPNTRKIFGRTCSSPGDIAQLSYNAEGVFTGHTDSPYHNYYPDAFNTWVSPNENIVIDTSGIIYNTPDLTYRGSLQGGVDDLDFYGDLPVVLQKGFLIAYSNTFLETGRMNSGLPLSNIVVSGDAVFGFYDNGAGPRVIKVPISRLNPAVPGATVDPNGLTYTPERVEIGSDETVYLLSRQHRSVFRWSVAQRRYLSTIPLHDYPYTFAYAPNENRLYIVYHNSSLYKIELSGDFLEEPFVTLPGPPCGLATVGSFVFTCNESDAWPIHTVFSPTGEFLSQKEWNYSSSEYIWNSTRHKMYLLRNNVSPYDLHWEDIGADGALGEIRDSPYHGDFEFTLPIRVKPDGSVVLIGTGMIFDGLTLSRITTLSNEITDAAWTGDTLLTLRSSNSDSEVQQWKPLYDGIVKSQVVKGSPIRFFPVGEGWLLITRLAGHPRFTIWSPNLTLMANPPLAMFSERPVSGNMPLTVHFTNQSSEGPYDTSLWEFGDGGTSTAQNPVHTYRLPGSYTVRLMVSGLGGTDALVKERLIYASPYYQTYLPSIYVPITSLLEPGSYYFDNVCWTYPLREAGRYPGDMEECVPQVDIEGNGTMTFYFTWTFYSRRGFDGCIIKHSDDNNRNMYIVDSAGNRYDHTLVGGVKDVACMEDGVTYTGWFVFPAAETKNTRFYFYDDDAQLQLGPIDLAARP